MAVTATLLYYNQRQMRSRLAEGMGSKALCFRKHLTAKRNICIKKSASTPQAVADIPQAVGDICLLYNAAGTSFTNAYVAKDLIGNWGLLT